MKRYVNVRLIAVAMALSGLNNIVHAQSNYKVEETKDIDMKLRGTSTLHKWEMNARTVEGEGQFEVKAEKLIALNSLSFALEVEDLKSDNKGLDKNAYKALKSDEYKDIHYKLISAVMSPEKASKNIIKTHGNLTIAGITKEIDMDVYCVINKNGTIQCTGSNMLKMTDYNVEPPSFMWGAMKTGDAITLDFVIIYKKQKGA